MRAVLGSGTGFVIDALAGTMLSWECSTRKQTALHPDMSCAADEASDYPAGRLNRCPANRSR